MNPNKYPSESVLAELEGTLVKDPDPFPYLMLVAFETSGPIRFALLLLAWPLVRLLGLLGLGDTGFKLAVFIAVAGVRVSELEYVGRAVMPKFYMDHIDLDAWRVFTEYGKKVVVSKSPRVMVEWFAKEHLGADFVIGSELIVNRFGRATGFLKDVGRGSTSVDEVFGGKKLRLGLGSSTAGIFFGSSSFMSLCEFTPQEQCHAPFLTTRGSDDQQVHPVPVVFHDGRLVKFPKPAIALLILLWIPIGVVLAIVRLAISFVIPLCVVPYENLIYGILFSVKGEPPKRVVPSSDGSSSSGVLFVSNHRTFLDAVALCLVQRRKIPGLCYSLSRFTELFAPIPAVRLTRNRLNDAKIIEQQLKKGDLIIYPEGTTCREQFLLRFSALFAELTDRIKPVAIEFKPSLFHATTARGWKGLDPIFFMMNPVCLYEVTFLDQLPLEETCSGGKSPQDVANNVQRLVANTLGFEPTNFTRKDKYRFLKGDDGTI